MSILKRSELKRTAFKPKRRSMNSISRTNSRKKENVPLRRAYMETHPRCLLCPLPSCDPHHIRGGTGFRHDVECNLAALCRSCHNGLHADTVPGRIEVLFGKWKIGELDVAGLDALGGERLAGWLARNKPATGVLLSMWFRLVKECE